MPSRIDRKSITKKIEAYRDAARPVVEDVLGKEILSSIARGVSPVNGRRFKGYSDSYKSQIRGEKIFRTINGKVVSFEGSDDKFTNKRVRPVNMKLSGGLIASFFIKIVGKNIRLGFDNELADIHNRRGAGKSKVIRRLLPTNRGEKFSRNITIRVNRALEELKKTFF